jgi:hypothetical protein
MKSSIRNFILFLKFLYLTKIEASTSFHYKIQEKLTINEPNSLNWLIESNTKEAIVGCLVYCNLNSQCVSALYSSTWKNCSFYSKYFNSNETSSSEDFDLYVKNGKLSFD